MRILYVFPHPDDESFGPGPAMSKQRREGYEVYLLTLTKGGATRQRFKYGHSIEEMGEVRCQEMQDVAKVLDLSGMEILDFPDSGLKEADPRELEESVREEIERRKPQVVVTYPVHGISGFHDHLITHAVVKRVFVAMKESSSYLRRLAFHTILEEQAQGSKHFRLSSSTSQEIDCVFEVDPEDVENGRRALDCYVTFQETIEKTGIRDHLSSQVAFEFFQEEYDPPVGDVFEGITPS